jgi:hypothetical protein
VIVFRALYLGGYDIVKEHYQLEHASRTTRFVAAQVCVLLRCAARSLLLFAAALVDVVACHSVLRCSLLVVTCMPSAA